jgi:hypothetical protein
MAWRGSKHFAERCDMTSVAAKTMDDPSIFTKAVYEEIASRETHTCATDLVAKWQCPKLTVGDATRGQLDYAV